ncbi:DNA topoisomerase [Moritella viscosa]|uniref:DNA topoisomerase n=1 Tax=Moritella viscosa TaxID=80854 RepID=A0A090K8M8_9GAMM|nr:putative uncharacterized protein [Moritella viscosa]SGZ13395.1 DNA topoisomerase [Moritella viscosa]SHO13278.1 DNA topoisomerase [Moritella viscosa]SHO13300.1 DNA topoisomerase [Moritella viscosa]SHO14511.1 DNA topoisomerase [Moritella viscosa]
MTLSRNLKCPNCEKEISIDVYKIFPACIFHCPNEECNTELIFENADTKKTPSIRTKGSSFNPL